MPETLQVLEKLNSFYSGAFTQLITYTVGVLAFVGVLIPLIISIMQSRQLKRDQKSTLEHIEVEIEKAKLALSEELKKYSDDLFENVQKKIEAQNQEIAKQIEKTSYISDARAFHLQGLQMRAEKIYGEAIKSACYACRGYSNAGDEFNLLRAIELVNGAFPNLSASDIENTDNFDDAMDVLFTAISKLNNTGRYTDLIIEIKRQHAAAKARVPAVIAQ